MLTLLYVILKMIPNVEVCDYLKIENMMYVFRYTNGVSISTGVLLGEPIRECVIIT